MAITAILFDLGNTLVEQRVDSDKPLDRMRLVLLPGVKETLPILYTKYKLAVLSNTSRSKAANVTEALEKLSVRRYFSEIVTSIDVGAEKPNPRIFEAVLRRLGVKPDQALMIGNDLVQDIEGAKAIGLRTGWFTGLLADGDAVEVRRVGGGVGELDGIGVGRERQVGRHRSRRAEASGRRARRGAGPQVAKRDWTLDQSVSG